MGGHTRADVENQDIPKLPVSQRLLHVPFGELRLGGCAITAFTTYAIRVILKEALCNKPAIVRVEEPSSLRTMREPEPSENP